MNTRLAKRMSRLQASPIRDVLASASQPGMISFAGGLPASDSFPAIDFGCVENDDLQYGPSEGEWLLRDRIAQDLRQRGFDVDASRVLVLSGSQQGIDLVAKLMIERGRHIAVESPTYLAALQVFKLFGATLVPFCIDSLEQAAGGSDNQQALSSDMLYVNPTFQNPSSRVYTASQRALLATACDSNQTMLFEDDPYRELFYQPCDRQPICSMLERAEWVYQSSFSKTLAPGLRLGYLVCSEALYPPLLKLKQAADLHSNRLSQRLVYRMLCDEQVHARLHDIQDSYRMRRDLFSAALDEYFGALASWHVPTGGLFFWLKLHGAQSIDTRKLLQPAIEAGVAFMPGEPFFINPDTATGFIRLNFSHTRPELYGHGLATLACLVRSATAGRLTSSG